MKKLYFLSSLLLLCVILVNAQVTTNFNNPEQIGSRGRYLKNFQGKSPFLIPARDTRALLEKEARDNASGEARPFQIAEPINVNIDVLRESEWLEENGIAYGKFTIQASGAKSISANFDQFYLPSGAELFVYSENGEMITGPVTESENNKTNFWGTWVYKGQKLTVDLKVPVESKSSVRLHISSIGYGYKDIYKTEVGNFGESEGCNINVLCALGDGWENERNSVSLILNASSSALCSGALINNTCNLNIPYLLTANHCFDTNPQQNVAQWKFTFQAWSPTCNPSQNANGITFNGSALRARNAGSDFCLVELNQLPSANLGITFSGWSRNTNGITNTTIIHHPVGDVMKISRDNQPPVFDNFSGAQCWRLGLDLGATQGGSSGSPYYDQNHRIIAQHFGINDAHLPVCDRVNKFGGRFDISWTGGATNDTRLSNWLDPNGTDAMTTDTRSIGISGPDIVCVTDQYFFAGQNVTWTSSNPAGLTINAGVATRVGNFNGQVTLTATIAGACGNTNFTKAVTVGTPTPTGINGPNYDLCRERGHPYGSGTFYVYNPLPGITYQWQVVKSNGQIEPQGSGLSVTLEGFRYAVGYHTIRVRSFSCNTYSPWYSSTFGVINCGSSFYSSQALYPNPASNEITVVLGQDDSLNEIYSLKLINSDQEIVYEKSTEKSTVVVPVSNLPEGTYYLNISSKEGIIQRRILVKR